VNGFVSWFRSSRRRRRKEEAAQTAGGRSTAAAVLDLPPRAELERRHLSDLHALAREAGITRYRLLRREELLGALTGESGGVEAASTAVRIEETTSVSRELARQIAGLARQLSPSAPEPTAADLGQVVDQESTTLLVARDGAGGVVGTLTLVVFRTPTGLRAWIEDVVVDERARRQGVGEALTREALRRASERGARTVDLTSRPQREAANRMYGRLGFRRRDTQVFRLES
jgi:ribosomal protein S18 acetylase RimI-like enzyme